MIELSRREFFKVTAVAAGSIFFPQACSKELEISPPPVQAKPAEFDGFSETLVMPFGSELIVETQPPHPRLKLNRPLLQKLLDEKVSKPTASIWVGIYPYDWIKKLPNNNLQVISDQSYQSLSNEERSMYTDGLTQTSYDVGTGIPKQVAVYIACGNYFTFSQLGGAMVLTNEFVPDGLITDPIIALNADFYHEVFYHALLRDINYRKREGKDRSEEEREAQFMEIEWVKGFIGLKNPVYIDKLFLIPSD